MKLSCIALDLDRTTLNSEGRLSEANRQALERAIAAGIEVIVASGRSLKSLPREILEMPGIRYAVTSNGAGIWELRTGECLKQYKLTAQSVREILALTREKNVAYEAFIDGEAYAMKEYVEDPVRFGAVKRAIPYIQSTRQPVEDMQSFFEAHIDELDSLDVVVGSPQMKDALWREMSEKVKDIYITSSVEQLLEISYKDCGKHSGVGFLLSHLGLTWEQTAAFGDGENDADLLRCAGAGIAVANASPGALAAADYVTRSNDEDGVAYGIGRLLAKEWKA